jgi:hypothetical protein
LSRLLMICNNKKYRFDIESSPSWI